MRSISFVCSVIGLVGLLGLLAVMMQCWMVLLIEFAEKRPKAVEKRHRAGEVSQNTDDGSEDCERGEEAYRLFLCTWRMLLIFGSVFLLARLEELI